MLYASMSSLSARNFHDPRLPSPLLRLLRINIIDTEGDEPAEPEIDLYEPLVRDEFDVECGSFGSVAYAPKEGESRAAWGRVDAHNKILKFSYKSPKLFRTWIVAFLADPSYVTFENS